MAIDIQSGKGTHFLFCPAAHPGIFTYSFLPFPRTRLIPPHTPYCPSPCPHAYISLEVQDRQVDLWPIYYRRLHATQAFGSTVYKLPAWFPA